MAGTAIARRPDGTIMPGHSGNPGGKPKGLATKVRELTDLPTIVERMNAIVRGEAIRVGGENGHVQIPDIREIIAAATWLADRGWGLPHQHVTVDQGTTEDAFDPTALSLDERRALESLLAKAAGETIIEAEIVEPAALEAPKESEP